MICFFIFIINISGSETKGLVSWAGSFFPVIIEEDTLLTDTFPYTIGTATVNRDKGGFVREPRQLLLGFSLQPVTDSLDTVSTFLVDSLQVKCDNNIAILDTLVKMALSGRCIINSVQFLPPESKSSLDTVPGSEFFTGEQGHPSFVTRDTEVTWLGQKIKKDFGAVKKDPSLQKRTPYLQRFFIFFESLSLGYRLLLYFALFAFFFLVNITVVATIIILSNWLMNYRSRWYEQTRQEIIDILSPLFFSDEENLSEREQAERELHKFTSVREKQVIIDVMLEARRNLSGNSVDMLSELYGRLKLDRVSIASAKSMSTYRRIMGIRELAYLSDRSYSAFLAPYLRSRNQLVRLEAVLAYILMEKESPMGFLEYLDRPFTRWIQLSAYYTMYFNNVEPPSLRMMLRYNDSQLVVWFLRLVAVYSQLDAAREVTRCLTNPSPEIRIAAIQTSLALENWKVKDLLKWRYIDEPLKVRIEILKFINYFAGAEDVPFLTESLNKGTFSEVREVVRILYQMDYNEQGLYKLNHSLPRELRHFVNHVAEPKNRIAV